LKAVDEYNKYRSPEATARIVYFDGERLTVSIEGSYVTTCGLYDWLEDLKYIFERFNLEAEIIEITGPKNPLDGWRKVIYKIKPKKIEVKSS